MIGKTEDGAAAEQAMKLKSVSYLMFEFDLDELELRSWEPPHELGGEVRLDFENRASIFVTTHQSPGDFHVEHGSAATYRTLAHSRDVSSHPLWARLIGAPISLTFRDSDQQILEIRSAAASVFCCSFERGEWAADSLYVASVFPEGAV